MFNTSGDLLRLTLAFCAIVITFFISWLLYYFIAIIRNAYRATRALKRKIDMLDEIMGTIKEQVSHMGNYLGLIIAGLEKIISYVQTRHDTTRKKNKPDKNAP
jgi:hypothetical protein